MLLIKFMIRLVYITVLKKFPIRREPACSWDHYNRSDWIKVTPLQNEKCLFYLYRQNGPPTIFFFFPCSFWHVDWLWLIAVSLKVPFTSIGTRNKIIQTFSLPFSAPWPCYPLNYVSVTTTRLLFIKSLTHLSHASQYLSISKFVF